MAFPPRFLDELRSRVPLGELVGRRVRLVRRGREYSGLCPFHNEKTPSFYVVEDKGFFHCFGCGAHGDAIGFVMRADNLDFIEAIERLAGEAGIAVPQQTPLERERATRQKTLLEAVTAAADFYEAQLWEPAGGRAREYLMARGLDAETIRRFHLGWAPEDRQTLRRALAKEYPEALLIEAGLLRRPEDGGSPYDYFRARVLFPISDRAGRAIAFGGRTLGAEQPKYLNSPDTPLFEKGRVLYGWSAARANAARAPGNPTGAAAAAIVVEGYMDVIALHCAGFGAAVAPLGTALTEMQLRELWRLSPEPVLCFDGDMAGQRAARRALDRALPLLQPGRSLLFATLPSSEDPDSLIRAAGPAAFRQVLATAQPLSEVLWRAELSFRPIDTPERRADLEHRLMAQAGQIADRSVQAEYRRFLRDRLFHLGRAGSRRPPLQAGRSWAPVDLREEPLPPLRSREQILNELRLKILVEHPFLVPEVIEEIARFDSPDTELNIVFDAILKSEDLANQLDATGFQQHLRSAGFGASLEAVLSRSSAFAKYLPPGSDADAVRREWTRINSIATGSGDPETGDAETDSSADSENALLELAERVRDELWAGVPATERPADLGRSND